MAPCVPRGQNEHIPEHIVEACASTTPKTDVQFNQTINLFIKLVLKVSGVGLIARLHNADMSRRAEFFITVYVAAVTLATAEGSYDTWGCISKYSELY